MIKGHEFLKTIKKMNDILSIIPSVSRMRKSLSMMTECKKYFYELDLKEWYKHDIEASIRKLSDINMLQVNELHADKCLRDAISAGNKLRTKIPGMLKKKFQQDPELAVYIKCHMDLPNSDDDGLSEMIADLLKDFNHLQKDENIEKKIKPEILDLVNKYFDIDTDLPIYADDIIITFGWFKKNPINVAPYTNLDETDKVSKEEMQEFFKQFDVIKV